MTHHHLRILRGMLMTCAILFVTSPALANPELTWETGKQQSPLTTRLSAEILQRLADRIIVSSDVDSAAFAFKLRNLEKGTAVKNIVQQLKEMPEPMTVDELAERIQLYLAIGGAEDDPSINAAKHYAQALEKAWESYSQGQTVLAAQASATARALLATARATDLQSKAGGIAILQFIELQLVSSQGAWSQFDPATGKAAMDGQLADNAALGLAFYEGYKATGDSHWLAKAKQLTELIFDRLYDHKLGGFFARNSVSPEFYRQQELFVTDKPLRFNGMAALLLYRVGAATGEGSYIEAAAKSIEALQIRALQASVSDITEITITYQALLEDNSNKLTAAQGLQNASFGLLVVLSFFAGVLGFLSPCTLPILPAYFAFASQSGSKNILHMTTAFFLGLALVFSLMGATATMLGALVSRHQELLLQTGGVLIVLFGLASIMGKGFSGAGFQQRPSLSLAGSFIFGMTFSVGWTACIGPILGVMLVLAATAKTAWAGAASLFIFALGLSLPLMALSLYLGKLDRNGRFWHFLKGKGWEVNIAGYTLYLHTTGIISGLIFIALGILMTTGHITYLNRILPIGLQAWFAGIEEQIVGVFSGV